MPKIDLTTEELRALDAFLPIAVRTLVHARRGDLPRELQTVSIKIKSALVQESDWSTPHPTLWEETAAIGSDDGVW